MEQSKLQQLRNEEELRGAFDVFDKDRDGAINKQDLKLLFTGLGWFLFTVLCIITYLICFYSNRCFPSFYQQVRK